MLSMEEDKKSFKVARKESSLNHKNKRKEKAWTKLKESWRLGIGMLPLHY